MCCKGRGNRDARHNDAILPSDMIDERCVEVHAETSFGPGNAATMGNQTGESLSIRAQV